MVEPGCEYRPLAPGILQVFAVGMFQKASVPGPARVKEAHSVPCTRPLHLSSLWGCIFSTKAIWEAACPAVRGSGSPQLCVHCPVVLSAQRGQLCSTRVPGSATHAGAGFGLFSESGCPNYGGGWGTFPFSNRNKTI